MGTFRLSPAVSPTLFSNAHYNATGSLLSATLGGTVAESRTYDSRLRPTSIVDGSNYSVTIPSSGGYAPNGDILAANDSVNGSWVYAYDDFNRLTCANLSSVGFCGQRGSGTPTYSYDYDRYGNRWHQNGPASSQLAFDANNRITGVTGLTYDSAGNITSDGTHTYFYDAENRIIQVDGTLGTCSSATNCYIYNAEGQRVRKTNSFDDVYDLAGNHVAEFCTGGTIWCRGEVYLGSRHLATYSFGTANLIHSDWLGTERVRTNISGVPCESITSLPFGDGQVVSTTCQGNDPSPLHFTGKERDPESGLDNFGARYDSSSLSRFMSPDPVIVTPARLIDPQRFNLYAYARNNPLNFNDPNGQDVHFVNDTEAGRKKALAKITKNLTVKEAANIGVRQKKDGSYEAYVVDKNAIGKDASKGYKQLTSLIGDHSIVADVGLIGGGLTATFNDLGKVSSYSDRDSVFAPPPGSKHVSVVVTEGDFPGGVQVLCCGGKGTYRGLEPDYVAMWHELIGETLKYRAGHKNLLNDDSLDSRTVIDIENEIRVFHGMNPRSYAGHGHTVITVNGTPK